MHPRTSFSRAMNDHVVHQRCGWMSVCTLIIVCQIVGCGARTNAPVAAQSVAAPPTAKLDLFDRKKACRDVGVDYDREQQKPEEPGLVAFWQRTEGALWKPMESTYCYSVTLNTCLWSGGSMLIGHQRHHQYRWTMDLLTNRELFSYSEEPLRDLSQKMTTEEMQREGADMSKWLEARHEFERKNEELLKGCAR
jgi:hypothetical protein